MPLLNKNECYLCFFFSFLLIDFFVIFAHFIQLACCRRGSFLTVIINFIYVGHYIPFAIRMPLYTIHLAGLVLWKPDDDGDGSL